MRETVRVNHLNEYIPPLTARLRFWVKVITGIRIPDDDSFDVTVWLLLMVRTKDEAMMSCGYLGQFLRKVCQIVAHTDRLQGASMHIFKVML